MSAVWLHVGAEDLAGEKMSEVSELQVGGATGKKGGGKKAMSQRKVYVAGYDRYVTLGQYVAAVKLAKANPSREFTHGLTCWWPVTGAEVMRQFAEGMQARINEGISYSQRGDQQ